MTYELNPIMKIIAGDSLETQTSLSRMVKKLMPPYGSRISRKHQAFLASEEV
jgi:hypothetical protein